MTLPRALLFDVDGTLADTEAAHRDAFNEAFSAERLGWYWSTPLYTRLLSVSGGKERISAYAVLRGEAMSAEAIDRLHADKTRRYAAKVAGGRVPLRPGVARLLDEARAAGVPVAIATTTTPANIEALLGATLGPGWRSRFAAVGDAATSPRKKPNPAVYRYVLGQLGLAGADCVAFEDSRNGVLAARAAGVPVIAIPTTFTADDDLSDADRVLTDLERVHLVDVVSLIGTGSAIIPPEAESEPCPDRTSSP